MSIMSLKETINKSVTEYLESTSIHGFGYLSTGRNFVEKALWLIIIICTCFTLAVLLICQSIEEEYPSQPSLLTVEIRILWDMLKNIFNFLDFIERDSKQVSSA